MADRIIKGDSGNDVIIQNNGGSRKIEVTNSGDVEVTGDVKTTTVKATNLKANDGTASLVVADSTGEVTSSGGLKAVNVKATNVKANDGTAGLVIADSTGALTASGGIADSGTITAGTVGVAVTRKVYSFSAYVSSQVQMSSDNTWYEVSALGTWTERWDSGQFASGRFTPTKSGVYLCGYTVFCDQMDSGERLESVMRKNSLTTAGNLHAYEAGRLNVSSDWILAHSGSSLITFNGTGDYVSLWALHNQGQSETYLDINYNEFWATYIGEI